MHGQMNIKTGEVFLNVNWGLLHLKMWAEIPLQRR